MSDSDSDSSSEDAPLSSVSKKRTTKKIELSPTGKDDVESSENSDKEISNEGKNKSSDESESTRKTSPTRSKNMKYGKVKNLNRSSSSDEGSTEERDIKIVSKGKFKNKKDRKIKDSNSSNKVESTSQSKVTEDKKTPKKRKNVKSERQKKTKRSESSSSDKESDEEGDKKDARKTKKDGQIIDSDSSTSDNNISQTKSTTRKNSPTQKKTVKAERLQKANRQESSSSNEETDEQRDNKVASKDKFEIKKNLQSKDLDSSTSDSGVDDPYPIQNSSKYEKEKISKEKDKEKLLKRKRKQSHEGEESSRIISLKKYVRACGIRVQNYNTLFKECKSKKAKERKLMDLLTDAGIEGKPTLEKCKMVRLKREEEKEIAELDVSNIISGTGAGKRLTRSRLPTSKIKDEPQKAEEVNAFANLAGIIDSDNSEDEAEKERRKPKRARIQSSSEEDEAEDDSRDSSMDYENSPEKKDSLTLTLSP